MKKIKYGNIDIIVAENYEKMSAIAGEIIADQVRANPNSVLGLATGSTPIGTYKHLSGLNLDFSGVRAFNLDEYYPIGQDDTQSYFYFMKENLFNHVNIKPENVDIPSGKAADADVECERYESAIKAAGGIDLQLLGLGHNGHIGFNEPCDFFPKATHHVALDASTIEANSRLFDSVDDVPKHALTMGIGTIFAARKVVMLISGAAKADIAKAVIYGKVDPRIQGSVLQLHHNITFVLDADAAKYII